MATKFLWPGNSAGAADGSSFANRAGLLGSITGLAAGDVIRMPTAIDPVSIGSCGFTNGDATVTIPSGKAATIFDCSSAFTGGDSSPTLSTSTTRKLGTVSSQIVVAGAFTSGTIAYKTISSTDFSSWSKISFWFRSSILLSGTVMGNMHLALCSDTAGATPVIDLYFTANQIAANQWMPIVLDNGGVMSGATAIQSVALYCDGEPGTPTILLDNIIACTDLTHESAFGKNSSTGISGAEVWYGIMAIDVAGNLIELSEHPSQSVTGLSGTGYRGTTETATGYAWNPDYIGTSTTSVNTGLHILGASGSAGSPITISGGWDRTTMTTQTGHSFFVGRSPYGRSFYSTARTYVNWERIVTSFQYGGFQMAGSGLFQNFTDCGGVNIINNVANISSNSASLDFSNWSGCWAVSSNLGWTTTEGGTRITDFIALMNDTDGIQISGGLGATEIIDSVFCENGRYGLNFLNCDNIRVTGTDTSNNANDGVNMDRNQRVVIADHTSQNNAGSAFYMDECADVCLLNCTVGGNSGNAVEFAVANSSRVCAHNLSGIDETTPVSHADEMDAVFTSVDHDGGGLTYLFSWGATAFEQTSVHNGSGKALQIQVTNSERTSRKPFVIKLGPLVVKNAVSHTLSLDARRNGTDIQGKLVIRGHQIAGVASDLSDSITVGVDTWTGSDLSVSFTPTEDGILEAEFHAWTDSSTTQSIYIDNLALTASSGVDASTGQIGFAGWPGLFIGEDNAAGSGSMGISQGLQTLEAGITA